MPRPFLLNSPVFSVLKFSPQEKSSANIGPDGLTEAQRARGHALGPRGIAAIVDRLFRAKIVNDAMAGYVPQMRERVCVEGRDEVFTVIYVDTDREVADLVSTERVGDLLESVAFSAIYPEPPEVA